MLTLCCHLRGTRADTRLAVLLALALAGWPAWAAWEAPLGTEHPLVGRIWDVSAQRFVSSEALSAALAGQRFVLLGEQHDNPDHHRLQARLVEALAAAGRRPAVAFEQLDATVEPALRTYLRRHPRDVDGLAEAVGWAQTGWPAYRIYRPVFAAALHNGLRVTHANLGREEVRAIHGRGLAALSPERIARLRLDQPLAPAMLSAMGREIETAHCGLIPVARLGGFVQVQLVRDAYMADRLVQVDGGDGAVLIAGARHVRADHGVPAHLVRQTGQAGVAALAFVEVRAEAHAPGDYAKAFDAQSLPFDYLWFTPGMEREPPCAQLERFRESLQRPGAGSPSE